MMDCIQIVNEMKGVEIIFFTSFVVLFYTYIGYGILAKFLSMMYKPIEIRELEDEHLPEVTHIIAAFNEEDIIEGKIANSYMVDYPYDKIRTVIVTDGSSDKTAEIVKSHPRIIHYHEDARKGKLHAINRAIKEVGTPIIVFSDANAMLTEGALKKMMKHFQNNMVGAVAGEKTIIDGESSDAVSAGEGLYWKYESTLKKIDYKIHSVVGAAGELFAVRTHLYEAPGENALIEDFITTVNIARRGYRVAYEPEAKVFETSSDSLADEIKRKVRISAGGLQAVWMLRGLLNPFSFNIFSFQYLSHRVLRWTLAPLAVIAFFVCNLLLFNTGIWYYQLICLLQLLFYSLALIGFHFEKKKIKLKAFFIPFYFVFMNVTVFIGLMKLISGNYSVMWEKAKRRQYA